MVGKIERGGSFSTCLDVQIQNKMWTTSINIQKQKQKIYFVLTSHLQVESTYNKITTFNKLQLNEPIKVYTYTCTVQKAYCNEIERIC